MIELVGRYFDTTLTGYANTVSATLMGLIWPVFIAGVTVWVLIHGYAVILGKADDSISEFVWRVMKVVFIAGIISPAAAHYAPLVNTTVESVATDIAASFLPDSINTDGSPTAWTLIQAIEDGMANFSVAVQKEVGITGFLPRLDLLAAWVMCATGITIFALVVTFVVLLSKSVLALYLAIGPIFIAGLLFRPTARFFESWLSAVLSAVVLMWVSFFLCGLTMHVAYNMLESTLNASGLLQSSVNYFGQASGFLAVCCVLALIAWQAPHVAAGLTGGSALQQGHQLATLIYRRFWNRVTGQTTGQPDLVGQMQAGYSVGYRAGAAMRSAASAAADAAVPAYQRAADAARNRLRK